MPTPWDDRDVAYRLAQAARQRHVMASVQVELERIKLERGCVDCGYRDHVDALEFDHVGPKRFAIGQRGPRILATVLKEVESCVVRCSNCHQIKSIRERRERLPAYAGAVA